MKRLPKSMIHFWLDKNLKGNSESTSFAVHCKDLEEAQKVANKVTTKSNGGYERHSEFMITVEQYLKFKQPELSESLQSLSKYTFNGYSSVAMTYVKELYAIVKKAYWLKGKRRPNTQSHESFVVFNATNTTIGNAQIFFNIGKNHRIKFNKILDGEFDLGTVDYIIDAKDFIDLVQDKQFYFRINYEK